MKKIYIPNFEIRRKIPNVEILLYDSITGAVEERYVCNSKTTGAINGIVDNAFLAAPTLGKPTHLAVGTGAPAANALGAEVARVALGTKTRAGAVATLPGDIPPGTATGSALTEAGIFDASSVGNMWFYTTFGAINKDANLDLVINWTYTGS